ncbi:DUF2523 domain-containing protein [Burkholderia cenocepacia]|uniref:DUF2523 family protein n=1 Tax=Burkholderia cenocepacia TaxID=95486 RepID=UPI001B8EBFCE|nr:DUF2523 family protein [Burkholderia cenocepacia]MBR8030379.1 DUF2523 domain-containing protein [Burkholderia cenocepacia]MBR8174270.1 DUF2523 domain-containing protein [Burkholderia cenocepacia]
MYGILISAANVVLGFVCRSLIGKFFAYFVLYFVTTEFVGVLQSAGILPTAASLAGAFGSIGSDVWYFLDLCAFSYGAPLVISAYATRFIIRRIPIIG